MGSGIAPLATLPLGKASRVSVQLQKRNGCVSNELKPPERVQLAEG